MFKSYPPEMRRLAVTMVCVLWLCGGMAFCAGFVSADYLAQHAWHYPTPVPTVETGK